MRDNMKTIQKAIFYLVVMLMGINCVYSQQTETPDQNAPQYLITTPDEAKRKALDYLGFEKMEGFSVKSNFDTANLVIINDDKTPFLHNKINNRDIWKATFQNITLTPDDRLHDEDAGYKRTFDVYIDPKDGKLLKIESIYTGENVDFAPEPGIEWAENTMSGSLCEFRDFAHPDSNYVGLFDVLKSLGPRNFKQLKAVLVIIPVLGQDATQAVWFVTYRGTDPYYPKGAGADLSITEAYNYQSFIYSAKTGQMLARTMMPSVELNDLK